jgi:hypothetical protein
MDQARDGRPTCANCGLEIPWEPVVLAGKSYCCAGCAQGGPCYCSYDLPAVVPGVAPPATREDACDATLHPPGAAPGHRRTA